MNTSDASTCVSASSHFGCMPYVIAYDPNYDDSVAVLAMVLSFTALAQVHSLITTRTPHPESYRAVSMAMWVLSVVSNIMWLFYGFMYRSYTLVISSVLAGCWAGWVVGLLIKYRYDDDYKQLT
jgi:uncharacterized protein with PQ loop repeat